VIGSSLTNATKGIGVGDGGSGVGVIVGLGDTKGVSEGITLVGVKVPLLHETSPYIDINRITKPMKIYNFRFITRKLYLF